MHFLSYKLFAYPLTLRPVRLQVEMRAQIEKKLQTKEQSMKEKSLKGLAKKVREENAGLRPSRQPGAAPMPAGPFEGGDAAERNRNRLKQQRARQDARVGGHGIFPWVFKGGVEALIALFLCN